LDHDANLASALVRDADELDAAGVHPAIVFVVEEKVADALDEPAQRGVGRFAAVANQIVPDEAVIRPLSLFEKR
jgi:hypothetical protein